MLMTTLQKGKRRLRLSFVICFRGAITFPQTGRYITSLRIDSEKLYEVLYAFEMPTDGDSAGKTRNEMKEAENVYEEK